MTDETREQATLGGDSQDPSNTDVDELTQALDPNDDVFGLLHADTADPQYGD